MSSIVHTELYWALRGSQEDRKPGSYSQEARRPGRPGASSPGDLKAVQHQMTFLPGKFAWEGDPRPSASLKTLKLISTSYNKIIKKLFFLRDYIELGAFMYFFLFDQQY